VENNRRFLGRFLVAVTLVGLGGSRAVAKEAPAADAPAAKTLVAFMSGPTLYETGRVGVMTVSDPTGSTKLDHQIGMMPKEQLVEPATADPNRAITATQGGYINASVLALQIREQMPTLPECRVQRARGEGRPWDQIEGGRVNLRWLIRSDGTVSEPEITAVDPIDLHLLDCIKQRLGAWRFAHPRGGMLPVNFSYAFK
jgi:hypothetical protein